MHFQKEDSTFQNTTDTLGRVQAQNFEKQIQKRKKVKVQISQGN